MSLMKYAAVGILLAIVASNAEEAKSSQNHSQLTSSGENRQQNKRLAIYGSPNVLNSGFKPITTSYPPVNNYVGNPQSYTSAASNVNIYSKTPYPSYNSNYNSQYNPYLSSATQNYAAYKSPSYQAQSYQHQYQPSYPQSSYQQSYQQPSYHQQSSYQPMSFASHPAQISYSQPPSNYAYSSIAHGQPQFYAQQIPFNHYGYNSVQPLNPVLHAAPLASFTNSYQTPANTFYMNPQQIHKVPIYNQQPQAFNVASYQPTNYHHQVKQISHTASPSQHITSKPVAVEAPNSSASASASSSSHVEHNHGAVSYAHISTTGDVKPSAAPLIATQAPQQVYYQHHQQPQAIFNGDYNKQLQYAAVPITSNYYPAQGGSVHYGNVPYAHISRIPFAPPTAASTLINSITTIPQKVAFH